MESGLMEKNSDFYFGHEKLEVYREAINFIVWISIQMESIDKPGETRNQLDRASSSIPLNIAEGNGKFTPADRSHYFDIAHGSSLECAAALDILVAKRKLTPEQIRPGKEGLQKIVRMLIGLIKATSDREYLKGDAPLTANATGPDKDKDKDKD
jgi:four helix bundle protein